MATCNHIKKGHSLWQMIAEVSRQVAKEPFQSTATPFPPHHVGETQPCDLDALRGLGHTRLPPTNLGPRSPRRRRLPSLAPLPLPRLLAAPRTDRQRQRLVKDSPLVLGRRPGDAGRPGVELVGGVVAAGRPAGGGGRVPRGPDLGLAVEVAEALALERRGGAAAAAAAAKVGRRRRALVPRGAAPRLPARRGLAVGVVRGRDRDVVRARRRPVLGAGVAGVGEGDDVLVFGVDVVGVFGGKERKEESVSFT